MDFPTPEELIANQCGGDIEAIRQELGVDSLGYLTIDELLSSAPQENGAHYCTACFSGRYPIAIDTHQSKEEHEA
jgi:amidophosphoribosyltransferase